MDRLVDLGYIGSFGLVLIAVLAFFKYGSDEVCSIKAMLDVKVFWGAVIGWLFIGGLSACQEAWEHKGEGKITYGEESEPTVVREKRYKAHYYTKAFILILGGMSILYGVTYRVESKPEDKELPPEYLESLSSKYGHKHSEIRLAWNAFKTSAYRENFAKMLEATEAVLRLDVIAQRRYSPYGIAVILVNLLNNSPTLELPEACVEVKKILSIE